MTKPLPTPEQTAAMLTSAMGQIQFARDYTLALLEDTPRELWFGMPADSPTNVAWQVGHLTVSQYGLLMFRIRGRQPDDLDLIPGRFRKAYGRGSKPDADAGGQPSPDELIERMRVVHESAMAELEQLLVDDRAAEVLLAAVEMPYAAYPNKLGAILFCPLHEQIHAGQIGLLRRTLGLESIR